MGNFIKKSFTSARKQVRKEIELSKRRKNEERKIIQEIKRRERLKNLKKLAVEKEKLRYGMQIRRLYLRKNAPTVISNFIKKQAKSGGGFKAIVKPPKKIIKRKKRINKKKNSKK